jgi:lipid-A-disaccharide synthase-like uncharacterized protein
VTAIQVLGWLGNAAFFSRSFVQWWESERERRSVAPVLFWRLSLLGSITLGAYAFSRHTHVLLAGYVINGLIYARNLWFQRGTARPLPGAVATLVALLLAAALGAGAIYELQHREDPSLAWVLVACFGQALCAPVLVAFAGRQRAAARVRAALGRSGLHRGIRARPARSGAQSDAWARRHGRSESGATGQLTHAIIGGL